MVTATPFAASTTVETLGWKGTRILVPTVTHSDGATGSRPLDFDRDILAEVDWAELNYEGGAPSYLKIQGPPVLAAV
jgi:hypothetical protein